jgi:hypothetical protein
MEYRATAADKPASFRKTLCKARARIAQAVAKLNRFTHNRLSGNWELRN